MPTNTRLESLATCRLESRRYAVRFRSKIPTHSQPIRTMIPRGSMQNIFSDIVAALDAGEPFALGIISGVKGSGPLKSGVKALLFADGHIVGTLGGGGHQHDALVLREWVHHPSRTHCLLNPLL